MTELSDVVIRYQKTYIDDVFYCNMVISGNITTSSIGQYSLVRNVIGSDNVYTMKVFNSTSTEKTRFEIEILINIEGVFSEEHPKTGELTDIYIEQNGVQQGDAYRFTVGGCRSEINDVIVLFGGLGISIYVLYKLTMWSSDTKKYSYE